MNTEKRLIPLLRFPEYQNEREWQAIELGEIGDVCMCKRIMKDETSPNGDIPFFKIGTFGKVADAFISAQLFLEYKEKYSYPSKGDILFSAAGTIGRCVEFDGHPAYFQDSNIVWIANNEKLVYNSFLKYVYSIVKWNIDDGGVVKRLYNDSIKKTRILIPSLPEQKVIAECLSSIDFDISSMNEKVEQLKGHKKSLMQKLFPQEGKNAPACRFSEFQEDSAWEKREFKEVIKVNSGRDYKHLGSGNIPVYGTGGYMLSVNGKLSDKDAVGIGRKGTIDRPQYLKAPFWTVDTLFFLTNCDGYDIEFIYYLSQIIQWKKYGEQTGVPSLSKNSIERLEVVVPTNIEEQKRIACALSSLDEEITLLEKKVSLLESHKNGLMQQLFPQI